MRPPRRDALSVMKCRTRTTAVGSVATLANVALNVVRFAGLTVTLNRPAALVVAQGIGANPGEPAG